MKTTKTYGLVAVAALVFGAAACGGDDDSGGGDGADSPLAQAIAAEMMREPDDNPVATQEDADCWAGRIVSEIGEDRLTELGVTVDDVGDIEEVDFTEDEVDVVVDSMFACIDVNEFFVSQFSTDFGEEGAACLADALDEDFVKGVMVSEFNDTELSEEFFQEFLDIAAECDLPLG